jgi:hypothetical protein
MSHAAITVLPNAVVAASTPVSCASIASAALCCSVRSSPRNVTSSGRPPWRLGDVDLASEHELERLRQFAINPRRSATTRRQSRPRFVLSVFLRREFHPENETAPLGLLDDSFDSGAGHSADVREKRPLVAPGHAVFVQEDTVALLAWSSLQR